ncbi:DUF3039 domain-containing protein [Candidatus Neomicrothrix sp.]|uniref:DUF3039 domain-containing protein n=1 Tax=Candidatus Neomicrothrix sp. TaxID=2719034 RepID=UPI0025B8BD2E|nr:DUF3039 domain-containing protein [Candidatus Microthrix sp.]
MPTMSALPTRSSGPSAPTLVPVETEAPRTDVTPSTDDGDHDRYAHIVSKADASRAYVTGEPITALCGKKWTPSRDPRSLPGVPQLQGSTGVAER